MNFATVYHAVVISLAQLAEEQFGGGKGAEKKKWVLDRLGEALDAAKIGGIGKTLVLYVSSLLIDFIVKKGLEQLGKP